MEFIERALALLLAFLLGFFSFIGVLIVGGYYAYTSVSYKSLVEWGVAPNADTYLDPTAEVNVQTLTIQKLLGEISKIQAMDPESLTVEVLLERYGINLPENVRSYLPESVTTISLQTLFSSEGLDQVMEDTNLDYVLQFVPEGVLSEPAKETLSGKNFKEIVSLNLSSLLENVYLGYFLGVNYTLVEDHYEIQYADANNPTLFEMVAGLDLKRVLDSFSGQDNLIGVIRDCLGDIVLTNVTKLFGLAQNAIVNALLQDETVASLIQIDGSGNPSIDIFSLVNGKYVGQILGYTPKYLNDDPTTEIVVGWLDGNNASVNGLMRGAYSILIDGLGGNTMDFSSMLSKVYLGDILGYIPSYDSNGQILEWKTTSNESIMPLFKTLVNHNIGEVFQENFNYMDLLNGIYIGYALGYTELKENPLDPDEITGWVDSNNNPISGIYEIVAGLEIGGLLTSDDILGDLTNGLTVGKILGITRNNQNVAVDANGNQVNPFYEALMDIDVGKLVTGDPDYPLSVALKDVYVGSLLGYTKVMDPLDDTKILKWTSSDGTTTSDVTGIFAFLSNIELGELLGSDDFVGTLLGSGLYVGTILGYTENAGVWYDANNQEATGLYKALAGIDVGQLVTNPDYDIFSAFNGVYVGSLLSYTPHYTTDDPPVLDYWMNGTEKVSGLFGILAGIDLGALISDPNNIGSLFNNVYVGDLLGYTKTGDTWFDANNTEATGIYAVLAKIALSNLISPPDGYSIMDEFQGLYVGSLLGYTPIYTDSTNTTIDHWEDGGTPLSGMNKLLAGIDIGGLITDPSNFTSIFNGLYVGDLLGYTKNGSVWMDQSSEVTGINKAISNIDLGQLLDSTSGYQITDVFAGLYLGDVLGYTPHYTTDDPPVLDYWENAGTQVSGMEAVIAKIDLGDLISNPSSISSFFNGTYVGELLSYTPVYDLVDTTKIDHWEQNNSPVSGINAAIANINLGALLDPGSSYDISSAFNGVKLGDILGYTLSGDVWMDGENPVTGIQKALAGVDLGNMIGGSFNISTILTGVKVGELLGYTLSGDVWMDGEDPVTGIQKALAGIDLGDLTSGSFDIAGVFNGIQLGEILGYTLDTDTSIWYKDLAKTTPVTGIEKALAGVNLGTMMGGSFNISDILGGVKVGELLGYTLSGDVWMDGEDPVTGIQKALAGIDLGNLTSGSFDIASVFDGIKLGEILGYTLSGGVWMDGENPVTGIEKALANVNLGDMMGGDFNLSVIFDGVKLGEVLGYTLYESVWYKDSQHTNPVTGIEKALSNVDLGQMVGGSFNVVSIFGDTLLGEVLGYTKEGSVWMKGSSPATGIELRLADVSLGTMLNGDFDITSLLTGMKIGELLGYTATASGWENNSQPVTGIEKALADTDLGKLMSGEQTISGIFSGMYLGDALGYYKNSSDEKWYENYDSSNKTYSTVVTGINGIVANVDLGAVLSGTADFSTLFNGVYLGSLLDYTKGMDDKWYSDTSCTNLVGGINQTLSNIDLGRLLGDPTYDITSVFSSSKLGDFLGYTYDETNHRWLDGSTPVSSFMNIVADRTISNMDGLLDDLTISDVMGYKTISGVLYEENGTTPVTGIMKTIATKKVTELGSCMSTLTVADALGYTDDNNDGTYQDEGGNDVTGFLGAVAPFKMEELSTKLASLKIGNIMGWDYDETTTTWYTDSTHTTAASGILKAFAGFTMDDMTDSSKMSAAIQGITLGEALGYTYNEGDGKWYMGTTPEDSSSFMSLIGLDTPIGQVGTKMTTTITTTTIQQFMDADILDFDSDTQATLTTMFDGDSWKDCNLSTFITELCAKMQEKMLDLQSQISYYQNLIPH